MSSKDDPFGPAGKTVIRANPSREKKKPPTPQPTVLGSKLADPSALKESTVFDPGIGRQVPTGWTSGTVVYQGAGAAAAPSPSPAATAQVARQQALFDASDSLQYTAANPIIAAAAPLLMLLGQLRLIAVDRQAEPLAGHVTDAIEKFDRAIGKSDVTEGDARIAKYVLCEAADDLIGNLPWPRKDEWAPHGMLSRFFHVEPTGTGFYEALNKVLAEPEAHGDLLELMHACLSLGFEGQYRGVAQKDNNLERIRRDVYETLRYFKARAGYEMSPHWQGLAATAARSSFRLPLWAVAATASGVLTAAFFALRVIITNEGDALGGELLALNPSAPIAIERASVAPLAEPEKVVPPIAATVTQTDRIRSALAKDIDSGGLTVGTKGDFIVVEISNLLLFQSGRAEVKPEFQPVATDIAAALEAEPGPIRIIGHTDNVKPRKSGTFKSNFDLSVARAKAVETMMVPKFSKPERITADGKGEDEPIADNATPEGRAKNRRVDVMIPKEETL
ncbi:type VI secretion system protein TssL, long form [Mesorhizobium sp. INR15]|uniref:type VI secretion system protein TssL, long form n=1 Tax=Mesorhizobium sp. INR15 TaxID=2654248 RepID=UPI0018968891|nr:type VI secretion system protein TssL, long form [Mesorhizobium sp. INR15]QPC94482.1 type VI secretion system protein TssL [Mesorhizobium sp. INR15]